MTINHRTGSARSRRHSAFAMLLACSALATPAAAQTVTRTGTTSATTQGSAQMRSAFPAQGGALPSVAGATATTTTGAQNGTSSQTANGTSNPTDPNVTTGTISRNAAAVDPPYVEDLNQGYEQTLDPGAEQIDAQDAPRSPVDPTGIRMGTFLLRPSINQSINTENTRANGTRTNRSYTATTMRGTLSSDWSRHALTVTGEGTLEKNLSGGDTGERPSANINADLRLDLSNNTVAHITGGYRFTRENNYDPNAIGGATTQSGVNQFTGGASVQRDFGKIRGTAAIDLTRYTYTDAKLANGTVLTMTDRNRNSIDGRLRLGYELSTALIPFVQVSSGRTYYDQKRDNSGYARSSQNYAGRVGVEFDLGEKLRGEVGTGYEIVNYDDARLKSVGAFTFDGNAIWSPQRGTDVNLGLRTTVQDSTTAGQSGWVEYQLTAGVAHQMRDNVVARLTGGATLRDFSTNTISNETVWTAGAGVTWAINRYLDLTGDVAYELVNGGSSDSKVLRAGVGLTLKR